MLILKIDIIKNQKLREMNFGDWEGLSNKEIQNSNKEYYDKWIKDYYSIKTPNGESFNDFYSRVNDEFDEIIKNINKKNKDFNLLIVSHSGVIRSIVSNKINGSIEGYWKYYVDNCSVTTLEFDESGYCFLKNLNVCGDL